MCSLSMVYLLKKSRNLFSFGCNTSLWAICRSFPLVLFLPATTKESVHLRKPLKGIWMVLSGVAWSLSLVPVWIAAPDQALRGGHNARMWRIPPSTMPWKRTCSLFVPGTRGVPHPVHAWHVSQGRTEATQKPQGSTMQDAVRPVWIFTGGWVTI